ncbi:MAG: LytR C-terminal domain-containing protein [Acidimicrobiales bacterium]
MEWHFVLDRVERSDVFNASALAIVLLFLGFLTLGAVGRLSDAVSEGLWSSSSGNEAAEDIEGIEDPLLRPANEVSIRVGNGSDGRQGLAARASRRLQSLGYGTLDAKNRDGDPIDDSFVYYIDGFKLDGIQVATVLNIAESQVRPLLDNPGVPTEGADIIVILGQNADF